MSELTLVKNFPNRAFAEQAREILERNDIGCILKSHDPGILGTSSASVVKGVDLYVEEDKKDKAFDLLNALYNGI